MRSIKIKAHKRNGKLVKAHVRVVLMHDQKVQKKHVGRTVSKYKLRKSDVGSMVGDAVHFGTPPFTKARRKKR